MPWEDQGDPIDAYAAGLIDGEGCIYITKQRYARVDVGMAEVALPLLEALAEQFGGDVYQTRAGTDRWQTAYAWTSQTSDATRLLRAVLPFLRLKRQQAELVIEAEEARVALIPNGGQKARWTPSSREWVDGLRRQCLDLNRKGPRTGAAPPAERLWRTPSTSLTEPSGEPFSGTWPRSGSMLGGIVYPLRPLAPRTSVTASSWSPLPTPRGSDANHGRRTTARGTTNGRLLDEELFDLLPTPTALASRRSRRALLARHWCAPGEDQILELLLGIVPREYESADEIQGRSRDLLPTPIAVDYGSNQSPSPGAAVRPNLDTLLASPGAGSSPPSAAGSRSTAQRRNPSFREWLMGAPEGWTDPASPLSATEFSSTPAATSESS